VLERAGDDPLLEQRHVRRADLDTQIAAGDHDGIGFREDLVERRDRLGLLDLRDHVRGGATRLDQRAEGANVGCRADERERDEVDLELHRELEIVQVLARDRRDRERYAGQIDALVR